MDWRKAIETITAPNRRKSVPMVRRWDRPELYLNNYMVGPYEETRLIISVKSSAFGGNCTEGRFITDQTMILDSKALVDPKGSVEKWLRTKPNDVGKKEQKQIVSILFRYHSKIADTVTPGLCVKEYGGDKGVYLYLTDVHRYDRIVVNAKKFKYLTKFIKHDALHVASGKNDQNVLILSQGGNPVGALAGLIFYPRKGLTNGH